jgi:DNA repair exonuclease SbcCD nuclease subunit
MKLLHAADLHLDTPMRGLVDFEDAPVEDLRFATRRALSNLVDMAIEEEIDLVLLAGDIFDGDWTHWNTGVNFVASYATAAIVDDLSAGYPAPVPDLINIGLLHTCADGRPGHERYAPCSVSALIDRGYDYWALGHVHGREVLNTDPPIVFPGNLQGGACGRWGRRARR